MAFHMLLFMGLCLVIVIQGRQPGPRPGENQEYPRSTILSAMTSELTSVYGNCSFPPNDVLTNKSAESYDILERCDSRIPRLDRPISDEGVITCLGLFEVGLRLCSLDEKYFKNEVLLTVPKDSHAFNTLVDDMSKEDAPNLCSDLKKVLGLLGEKEFSVLNKWNLLKIFQEAEGSCTRICFDYKNNARLMCKLILWGSNLLMQSEPKPFESTIGNSAHTLQSNTPHEGTDKLKKNIATSPTFGSETSAIGLEGGDEQQVGLNQESAEVNIEHEDTQTGAKLEPSSPAIPSLPSHEANVVEEGQNTHVMPDLISKDDQFPETSSKSGSKNISTKLIDLPSKENQTPYGLVSEEIDKISNRQMESRTPISKHNQDLLDKGATNPGPKTNLTSSTDQIKQHDLLANSAKESSRPLTEPTSSIDGNKPQDISPIEEGAKKSTPITNPSVEGSKPQDAITDGNSVASPPEKTLPDMSPRGEEFHENYDSSMDQNPDLLDDEVNFPPAEPESPSVNQEPTGYKTDYKYPREEFTNGNTFLQERFEDSEDSHFFSYFMAMIVLCIVGYVVFHNKQKILALALEGRSRRGSRRRPTTANYHKLDNNLEEAVSSPCSTSVTHVIY